MCEAGTNNVTDCIRELLDGFSPYSRRKFRIAQCLKFLHVPSMYVYRLHTKVKAAERSSNISHMKKLLPIPTPYWIPTVRRPVRCILIISPVITTYVILLAVKCIILGKSHCERGKQAGNFYVLSNTGRYGQLYQLSELVANRTT